MNAWAKEGAEGITTRRYTRARRERDVWVSRGYVGDTCVAIVTSTVSAEDAERVAAERAGVEWTREEQGDE